MDSVVPRVAKACSSTRDSVSVTAYQDEEIIKQNKQQAWRWLVETHQLPSWQPKDVALGPTDDTNHGGQQCIGVWGVDISGDVLVTSWGDSVPSTLIIGEFYGKCQPHKGDKSLLLKTYITQPPRVLKPSLKGTEGGVHFLLKELIYSQKNSNQGQGWSSPDHWELDSMFSKHHTFDIDTSLPMSTSFLRYCYTFMVGAIHWHQHYISWLPIWHLICFYQPSPYR